MSFISFNGVSFSYTKGINTLYNINFDLEKGRILGLLGHNGSGKSTLLKILSRLEESYVGEYCMEGQLATRIPKSLFYRKTGILVESPGLYGHLTSKENLKLFASFYGNGVEVDTLLRKVNMEEYADTFVANLSTGMKQRLGIAIAIMGGPDLLLLDEPTNGLDPDGIIEIRKLILQLRDQGKTLIISSHLLSEIERICDDILILKKGNQIHFGTVKSLGKYRDLEEMYISLSHKE